MRNGAMPNRQHTSATPSPRATFTPTFQKQRSPLENRDLTLWRFGFRVRENKSVRLVAPSATGLKKKKKKKEKWCETMYGKGLFAFCFQT